MLSKGHIAGCHEERAKKINFCNKPISNFDIINRVKELKIKNFDGAFNTDSRRWASDKNNCGLINLDNNNGPGTHWACYVDSFFILIPLDYHCPKIFFIKRYNTFQYQEKISVLCCYFCLFSLKIFKMVIQIYAILYKILDPINPSRNEIILKDYFINMGMFNNEIKKRSY